MPNIKQLRSKVDQLKGQRDQCLASLKQAQKDFQFHSIQSRRLEEAQTIIRTVALQTQQELQFHISSITTMALEAVFPDPYAFEVEFVERRGKTEADMFFTKNGKQIDPMSGSGGGAVDIAAFSLRPALRQLQPHASMKFLALDEPFRFLSKNLQPQAAEMLREITSKLGLQILMVTHNEDLMTAANKSYFVTQSRGVSKVTEENNNGRAEKQSVQSTTVRKRTRKSI